MSEKKKPGPIHRVKTHVFGEPRARNVLLRTNKTREGTQITLKLDPEIYNAFQGLVVVILQKKDKTLSLVTKHTTIDAAKIREVRRILAEANNLIKNGGGRPCGSTM